MRKFNLYFAIAAVVVDALMIYLAMFVAYQLRADGTAIFLWPPATYAAFVLKFLPIWLLLLAYQGLYNVRSPIKGWTAMARLATAILSGWGVILIYLYLSRSPEALVFPRLIIAYGVGLTLLFTFTGRSILDSLKQLLNRSGYGLVRTAIVAKRANDPFVTALAKPVHARILQGVVTDNFIEELDRIIKTKKVDELIVVWPDLEEKKVLALLDWAETNFINFAQVPTLLSVKATNVETSSLGNSPIIYFKASPLEGWGRVFKRLLDLAIVIPAIIILSPLYLILAITVKLSSPGPVIYREERVGQDGRRFFVGKFRSMYANWRERFPNVQDWSADEKSDPRITPLGRLIRRTYLDELPQMFDVLTGAMSLVGPRPEQSKYVQKFAGEVPNYIKRHHVKSGVTGWAQVNGLRGDTSIEQRVRYDLYYIENWSIWFDIRIIISTFILILRQMVGAR
jgi:exopolysaccharide biosynthesis polyprenyl glycosylphosphotransferase